MPSPYRLLCGLIHAFPGDSKLGTDDSPELNRFVDGPKPGGGVYPWGDRSTSNTNPYKPGEIPNTGITRQYDWTVTNTTMSPDGVETVMLVVNNQFPGPMIEANWGDWIEITVHNELKDDGTAIHWHGFLQTGTPWYDGVSTVSQCPIAPGTSFTYRIRAELFGTTWWHGHHSSQYLNGLSGPMVVHGPATSEWDIDLGPVMLTDWFHAYYEDLIDQVYHSSRDGPILPPMANNMLINGKANYPCSETDKKCTKNAGLSTFKFKTGKKHLLRLINHSAEAVLFFSIDGYNMTVITHDFVAVDPYRTDMVTLGVGQRAEVIVKGRDNPNEAVWMRVEEGPSGLGDEGNTGCSLNDGVATGTKAMIFYEKADHSVKPKTKSHVKKSRFLYPDACGNDALDIAVPSYKMNISDPEVTLDFTLSGGNNATGEFVWYMNNETYMGDFNDPLLLDAVVGAKEFPDERRVFNMGNAKSVRIIMHSVGLPASHPMHAHGHNMHVLAEGTGDWNGDIVNESNPARRDVQLIRPNGYLVIQLELDNPGLWRKFSSNASPFHSNSVTNIPSQLSTVTSHGTFPKA
jgi:FtsP/CotA-like multicopper oxidase with cupredoxin domain